MGDHGMHNYTTWIMEMPESPDLMHICTTSSPFRPERLNGM